MKNLNLIIFIILVIVSCSKQESLDDDDNNLNDTIIEEILTDTLIIESNIIEPTINQGFYGFVLEWKGDFMPGTTNPGTIDSVSNEIYVFQKLTFDSIQNARVEQYSLFWYVDSIKQKPIKIIKTNNKGFYQVELDSGNYSGLVKYNETTFYNNGGTSDGQLGQMIAVDTLLQERNFNIDFEKSE